MNSNRGTPPKIKERCGNLKIHEKNMESLHGGSQKDRSTHYFSKARPIHAARLHAASKKPCVEKFEGLPLPGGISPIKDEKRLGSNSRISGLLLCQLGARNAQEAPEAQLKTLAAS